MRVGTFGIVKSDTDLDDVEDATSRMDSDQVCSIEDTNEYKWPEISGKDENSRGVQFDSGALLKSILCFFAMQD